eukprot:TRINITY_DN994_c0_g1_i2.p1 TRINITY_DN994_c0_g1~~TRINITY_DN994_c0_g1_i2.p1  ORF type:complete len:229 (-),score=49.55 TRINITY_DN994_c0_g1_i2:794-1480(-)
MEKAAARRVGVLLKHIQVQNCGDSFGCSVAALEIQRTSANTEDVKKANKYYKIHGEVPLHPAVWTPSSDGGPPFTDIIYEKAVGEGIAKITINRPERRNAFRPQTVKELMRAFNDARDDIQIGVIILTGKGTDAFSSGGDQAVRGEEGYADYDSFGRLNVLDLQVLIRRFPKPVIAMVAGYAVGGGHVLHMVCDITIAADNAVFGQTGPKVGSFDAGYGCSIMSRLEH